MNRRDFIVTSLAALGLSVARTSRACATSARLLNAYYFRAGMGTFVPKHVRDDVAVMKACGTMAITLSILEQDFTHEEKNLAFIVREAQALGLRVFAMPSRWAGLFSGSMRVPSLFTAQRPHTWILKQDGSPLLQSGMMMSSIHHPETTEFFKSGLKKILDIGIDGIIWHEPKGFRQDFSPTAVEKLGKSAPKEAHVKAFAAFVSSLNGFIKQQKKDAVITLTTDAASTDDEWQAASAIEGLDYFGCDGKPFGNEEIRAFQLDEKEVGLLDVAEKISGYARKANAKLMFSTQNHSVADADLAAIDRGLPKVIAKQPDHLAYYFYPRNTQSPDKLMEIYQRHLKTFSKS